MLRIVALLIASTLFFTCSQVPQDLSPYALVNPFIGTGGHGHTYPGAAWPFGMVQLSPDTRLEGWDGCSGYHYTDDTIYGFSHTHLSGTGVGDYGDVLLMPFTSEANPAQQYFCKSKFDKEQETASPGFYSVYLNDEKIQVELTTGRRSGYHSYEFEKGAKQQLYIDLDHRDEVLNASIEFPSNNTIQGHRVSKAWAEEQHVYFYIETSAPYSEVLKEGNRATLVFENEGSAQIVLEVGISAVSILGAKANLKADQLAGSAKEKFTAAKDRNKSEWEKALEKITVKGGSDDEQAVFYSSMYHSLLNPNLFTDADGQYRGLDQQIHKANGYDHYTVFSLWDTYRATHPLFTIIEQDRTNDFIQTFLSQYKDGGKIPIWELAGNYTGCMIGYHAIPVIADAWIKDIRGYDGKAALNAMVHSAELDELGLKEYMEYGFIPSDVEPESVSKTLEYSYDDWCISMMAASLEDDSIYKRFNRRSNYWKNIFDPQTGFMRARLNGAFVEPFAPAEVNFHYTEANAWQYSMMAPHDVDGLANMFGGKEKLAERLDALFVASSQTSGREQADITGLIGQYAHGNEPSHHMAYLYNYVDQPWKSQAMVRRIMTELYSNQPDGLSGNEDCGQMSSWFVLSAAGFYPVAPGESNYSIGSPLFNEIEFKLENGNAFKVIAENNNSENVYIQSATLNGDQLTSSQLSHFDIIKGGELVLQMTNKPQKEWGVTDGAIKTPNKKTDLLPSPYLLNGARVFDDEKTLEFACANMNALIKYRLNKEEEFKIYKDPIIIRDNAIVEFFAWTEESASKKVVAEFFKRRKDWKMNLQTTYAPQYAAGGDLALIDQLRGGSDYRTGMWQGFEHEDLVCVVDQHKSTFVKEVAIGFMQDENSWIFMPTEVQFELSEDGINFTNAGVIKTQTDPQDKGTITEDFKIDLSKKARFIRVTAKSLGYCPDWHKGAGGKCWIFADEILINE
ncbi:MAG: putative alpha-1,2-mannosidase [Limisphaerales bacterium]|jgi:predicted alpha-1,2-mannosidase